jgi:hypothetical protein
MSKLCFNRFFVRLYTDVLANSTYNGAKASKYGGVHWQQSVAIAGKGHACAFHLAYSFVSLLFGAGFDDVHKGSRSRSGYGGMLEERFRVRGS